MYIGVLVQQNQFLSKYGLRTIFFEKKRKCEGGAKADAVFCKLYRPNKSQPKEREKAKKKF